MTWDEGIDGNRQGSSPSIQWSGDFGYPRGDTERPVTNTSIVVIETAEHFNLKPVIGRMLHDGLRYNSTKTRTRLPLRLLSLASAEE